MSSPRGRIIRSNRPVGQFQASGLKPVIIAYVKVGASRHVRDFWHYVQRLGLEVREVQECVGCTDRPFLSAFEVIGTPETLAEFTVRPCVKDWHFVLDTKLPMQGTGSGDKPKRRLSSLEEYRIAHVAELTAHDDERAQDKACEPKAHARRVEPGEFSPQTQPTEWHGSPCEIRRLKAVIQEEAKGHTPGMYI